jgi:hypothetical protein
METISFSSSTQTSAPEKILADGQEKTFKRESDSLACTQTVIQLYRGWMKVYMYTNQNNELEGSTAIADHRNEVQATGLAFVESFILCSHQTYRTNVI